MFEILKNMIKEEWRIHSSLFGSFMFALFPIMIAVIAFIGSLFLPIFQFILPVKQILLFVHYLFVLFGLSIGSFGLFGREVMNRRFGQASMIAYSSRSLPVSERKIFFNFFIKDIIYYFILWILPFVVGLALASPFLSLSLIYSISLLLTLTLSFLIGLSIAFFLSTIYAHSSKLLIGILVLFAILGLFTASYLSIDLLMLLPSLSFFFMPSLSQLVLSLLLIITPSTLSLIFLKIDYPKKERKFKNSLVFLSKTLKFGKYSNFISKDFLDLNRSEGGLGKIIFSLLFPIAVVWLLLALFLKFVPIINVLVIFSMFLGVISSSIYNWLTQYDLFTSYSFLPVKVSDVMKSKTISYILINLIPLVILILVALGTNQSIYFLPALFSFLTLSSYTLSITILLTGLHPNILLYNAKIFLEYLFSIIPILLILIFLSLLNPFFLILSPILILLSFHFIKKSYIKWDKWEQPSF